MSLAPASRRPGSQLALGAHQPGGPAFPLLWRLDIEVAKRKDLRRPHPEFPVAPCSGMHCLQRFHSAHFLGNVREQSRTYCQWRGVFLKFCYDKCKAAALHLRCARPPSVKIGQSFKFWFFVIKYFLSFQYKNITSLLMTSECADKIVTCRRTRFPRGSQRRKSSDALGTSYKNFAMPCRWSHAKAIPEAIFLAFFLI